MFFFEIIYLLSIFFNDYSYSLLGGFNEHSLPLNEVCSFLGIKNLIYNLIKIITYIHRYTYMTWLIMNGIVKQATV